MSTGKGVPVANAPQQSTEASPDTAFADSASAIFHDEEQSKQLLSIGNAEQPIERTALYALLEKRSDLDLAGKVRISDTVKGHGGYSDVYIGIYTKSEQEVMRVAVKKFRVHLQEEKKVEKALAKELRIWSELYHPRILRLEGFYLEDSSGFPCLISEWMDNGTAWKYLAANPHADVLSLVVGIADGVSYLHSKDIIHSDLKPENVLISDRGEPLVCDFGISRTLAAFALSTAGPTGIRGTIRYISKEIFRAGEDEATAYCKASDVWAFGMTVYALVTRSVPYYNIKSDAQVILAIAEGKLPSWPALAEPLPEFYPAIQGICRKCWVESTIRKTIGTIAEELRRLEQSRRDTLWSLLANHADLNLAGKVKVSDVIVGQGGYSDVFMGCLTRNDGSELKVAVKKLRVFIMKEREIEKALAKELYIWSKLHHPRILPLEGFYIGYGIYPHLVSPWMKNGTAMNFLKDNPGSDVLSLIIGVAEGIQYLHSKNLVHSNIKPENIMISDLGEPLLCDFGDSRMLAASQTFALSTVETAGLRGTIRYIAKEILRAEDETCSYSKESDIWAFGMTTFALVTKNVPYHDMKSDVQVILAIVRDRLPSWSTMPESDLAFQQHLRAVCSSCWLDVSARPAIDEVLSNLRDLQHNLSGPMNGYTILKNVPEPDKNGAKREEELGGAIDALKDHTNGGKDEVNSAEPGHATISVSSKRSSNESSHQPILPQKERVTTERTTPSSSKRVIGVVKKFIPRTYNQKEEER